ncbi:unnamed protein product [Angiostrongylus costaricensis]|uniref:DUF1758 domain-containing protein n=1 Tax=Angiostrongylus costaricensis TaxID=334426 RepID=A0A158PE59_ANGCS|nr:unnamed protein product [Angiostrongylus costaricensis]
MSNVRLLSFSYSYAVTETDDHDAKLPNEIEQVVRHMKSGVIAQTPVPTKMRNKNDCSESSSKSSQPIPLRDIERVLPIYLKVYFKEKDKTKRALVECEVKNNQKLIDMLSVMLPKLKTMKGQSEASGRMYYTQRKFRKPAVLDYKSYSKIIIEDLADMDKSMFFVFDMAGRMDKQFNITEVLKGFLDEGVTVSSLNDLYTAHLSESLQVVASDVVADDMLGNTVEPQQYVAAVYLALLRCLS